MNPLTGLVNQFKKFPGVGQKSAERLAFYILSISQHEVNQLTTEITLTKKNIRYCRICYNISFEPTCFICSNSTRDKQKLCIVADPKDIFSLEKSNAYNGLYHVLGGLISPLDNIDPESLRINELLSRIKEHSFNEIILAINPSVEGDTTSMYLISLLKSFKIKYTKLAHGLPMGANIDYTDEITLKQAITGRTEIALS